MRFFVAPALLAAGLAACTTTGGVNVPPAVCQQAPLAYAAFQIFAPNASPQVRASVTAAYTAIQGFCANPNDWATGLAAALNAYAVIQQATP